MDLRPNFPIYNEKYVRLERLRAAIQEYPGKQVDFSSLIRVDPSFLSQMKSGKANVPNDVARRIEAVLGKPHLWMDTPISDDTISEPLASNPPLLAYSASSEQRYVVSCPCCNALIVFD